MSNVFDVAIIGAGPAGISCAIQLKRFGVKTVLLEKQEIGGLLKNANLVENYPGYSNGLSGVELIDKFKAHLQKLKITPVYQDINNVSFAEEYFILKAKNSEYRSKLLIVASGTKPKELNININDNLKNSVFYEVHDLKKQDLAGKKIIIIGSGDAAFDYAMNLADNTKAEQITILNRSNKTKCIGLLKERIAQKSKINYIENVIPDEFKLIDDRQTILCTNGNSYQADCVLGAIGRHTNTEFLDKKIIEHSEKLQNNKKLYFIGDVKNDIFRQTTIAVGNGIRAAMEANLNLV